jgi:hypothetical protein
MLRFMPCQMRPLRTHIKATPVGIPRAISIIPCNSPTTVMTIHSPWDAEYRWTQAKAGPRPKLNASCFFHDACYLRTWRTGTRWSSTLFFRAWGAVAGLKSPSAATTTATVAVSVTQPAPAHICAQAVPKGCPACPNCTQ